MSLTVSMYDAILDHAVEYEQETLSIRQLIGVSMLFDLPRETNKFLEVVILIEFIARSIAHKMQENAPATYGHIIVPTKTYQLYSELVEHTVDKTSNLI